MQEGSSERGPSAKRRKSESKDRGDTGTESRTELRIQPGESMAHFNRCVAVLVAHQLVSLTMHHVARRVEDSLRGQVRVAMKTSSALARKVKKEEEESSRASKGKQNAKPSPKSDDAPSSPSQSTSTPKPSTAREKPDDFERLSTSAPRRLNDIVQAPPELKKLPRGAKQRPKVPEPTALGEGTATLRQGALSMAQKAMLEEERLKAIKLYREMKKAKTGE